MIPMLLLGQQTDTAIQHSIFIAGPDFTGIVGEEGEVIWDTKKPGARDGFVHQDGRVLVCWADEVREYDQERNIVFSYKRAIETMELGTAVYLGNERIMITESGEKPQIVEVDTAGNILSKTPLAPETDNVHMQTRMARKLLNGNYLVPHLLAFAIKEYTPGGKVVNVFRTDLPELGGKQAENWPFTAIRLSNGNTLVTLTHGNKIVEMDSTGKIVWSVSNNDLKNPVFADPCGAQRLPNGNTVIASYGAKEGIKLFEINASKEMVWNYSGFKVHHFQILTTNGQPLEGPPLK